MFEITTVPTRARGTDLVRLRPASASVRFLEIFPVRRPNSSLRRTIGLRPPSASVRFQNFFSVRRPNPSLRRTKRICPPSASVRFEKILTVLRPNPSFGRTEGVCPPSAFVRFKNFKRPPSGSARIRPPRDRFQINSISYTVKTPINYKTIISGQI